MGLDVYSYKKILFVSPLKDLDPGKGQEFIYVNPVFLRYSNLKTGVYSFEEIFRFEVGSYTGYCEWRSQLARMIKKVDRDIWENPVPGAFLEIIHFTDCDGVLGADVCKKLYQDFKKYHPSALKIGLKDPDFLWTYRQFMKALRMGSQEGCVVFG